MKYNIKARVWVSILFFIMALCAWWFSSFNFNVRGEDAVLCFFTTVAAFISGITCPVFD